jgi:hypothetical protein
VELAVKRVSFLASIAAVSLLWALPAKAATIYQAPGDNNNQIGFTPCCGEGEPGGVLSGPWGVGNTITFAGSGNFNLGTVDLFGYAGGGSKPIEVDLYSGANPNTGTLLGSAQVIPTGNGYTTEVLNFNNLLVPDTLTFIVSIVGNTGSYDDSFVNWQQFTGAAGAPTIGTSGNMWYGSPDDFIVDNTFATANGAATDTLGVQFNVSPTPLPSTWTMMIAGFIGLGFLSFHGRKNRSGSFTAA